MTDADTSAETVEPLDRAPERPRHLSPSAAGTFEQCPRRWRHRYVERLPDPPGVPALVGTFSHRVLELLLAEEPADRTLDTARRLARQAWPAAATHPDYLALGLDDSDALAFRWKAWKAVEGLWRLEDPADVDVVATEQRIEVTLSGVPFVGVVDRLSRYDDGALSIDDFKALPLNAPLPTPDGWTTMGAVAVGDQLFGSDGQPVRVVGKSALFSDRPGRRVVFDDGSDLVCDPGHEWTVTMRQRGPETMGWTRKTVTADELAEMTEGWIIYIDNAAALETPEIDLPIDPWVLGAWLGDGHSRGGQITVGWEDADDMCRLAVEAGERVCRLKRATTGDAATGFRMTRERSDECIRGHKREEGRTHCNWCIVLGKGFPKSGKLSTRLRYLGLLHNKHVPERYLRASRSQRLALLQGLMDTDGYWHKKRKQAIFVNTNRRLADAVYELVVSLGWRASRFQMPVKGRTEASSTAYRVTFTPFGEAPFRLPRKARLVDIEGHLRSRRRYVKAVEPAASEDMQCIVVDAPDSLFLAGRQMVPTHNSGTPPKPRYEADKLHQVLLYVAAVEAATGERAARARLLYLGERTIGVEATPKRVDGAVGRLSQQWALLTRACDEDRFDPNPGPLCGWCPYIDRCPAGAAEVLERQASGRGRRSPALERVEQMDLRERTAFVELARSA